MERDIYHCTRTGRTILEKTMEDGNIVNTKDEKFAALPNSYSERAVKLTTNGHDIAGETSSPPTDSFEPRQPNVDAARDDKFKKRINPLRIHLGKRPFVDNSIQHYNSGKKKKPYVIKGSDTNITNCVPRVPKLVHKRLDISQFHHVTSHGGSAYDNEQDKPVPRLVPKSQLSQYKKGKIEKGPQLKEYAQSLGLQPMVKFKCRKCCSMSFKTLAMLKEHQLVCRAQAKEPALSPEATVSTENNVGGPSRVTRKVYLCSACGTYYENWNLFLHMREVHNRHICLFCLGMFSKAEKLSSHLTNKHNVQEFSYDSKEDFLKVYNGNLYLMCCACDEICSEQDDFFNHDCNNVKPRPVPVRVNKTTSKPNNLRNNKTCHDTATNGPSIIKEVIKPACEKKDLTDDSKIETIVAQPAQKVIMDTTDSCEPTNSDTSISSENSVCTSKDTSNTIDSGMELDSSSIKPVSPILQNVPCEKSGHLVPNGDDSIEESDGTQSPLCDEIPSSLSEPSPDKNEEPIVQPIEKEKECGIKLKLSLNKANSPVIINSTVDPTIGQQNSYKPPSRVRRPPKRYEKEPPLETPPTPPVLPKTPSIKMTICDKADSPFVKTTFYEEDKETTLKTLLNNNLDSVPEISEYKTDNSIKTTIYDNKLEEVNTLNRVPKLTVRVPKELLDKDSSSDYSSDSDVSDKLTVDENNVTVEEEKVKAEPSLQSEKQEDTLSSGEIKEEPPQPLIENVDTLDESESQTETKTESIDQETPIESKVEEIEIPVTELSLDKPLDKYELRDLLKVFLTCTAFNCIYCNHVRKIAVNCEQLSLHMVAQHRFTATVNSITAEELMPETITARLKAGAPELRSIYINLKSYDSVEKFEEVQFDHIFECFQCYFKTAVHKELYLHNRKMHQKTILLCVMCKSNFYSYSELLCHLCPGTYDSDYEIKFRCCLCNVDSIPSSFRLMVHLRKIHHTCDVCLEFCHNQARLSNHVWKHKLHHLCYRCGIAYRNKPDITNHLFWKHGTESVLCKKCLQKKWPHVYHFCTPPAIFVCEECNLQFTKAVFLKVHKRFHSNEEYPHGCTEEGCTERFVSRKLLEKHVNEHKLKLISEDLTKEMTPLEKSTEQSKEPIPVIDLLEDKPKDEAGSSEIPTEIASDLLSKKAKKKKLKEKDALLLDVNLPALDLSESDSSDESDSGIPPIKKEEKDETTLDEKSVSTTESDTKHDKNIEPDLPNVLEKPDPIEEEKPNEQQILDIWDNFKKYQAKVEKQKEKTPPLVPIRKHVCESDHDYCLIPSDLNGDDDPFSTDKKKNKKSPKKRHGEFSSSSSSSSDSDSSCSCGSNCSCSSSSGSSSSSSSDSDSSDDSSKDMKDLSIDKKKKKQLKKSLPNRRISNGSNVDVMGMSETPVLIPEKVEPPIAETDLETEESETDEEFYDEHPQRMANKLHAEKRNQLMLLASVAPSDGGSVSGEASRPSTPVKEEQDLKIVVEEKEKSSSKKKSKKKKKSRSSKKHGPIKLNIPKDIIAKSVVETPQLQPPNKITISLHSNTVQLPETPTATLAAVTTTSMSTPTVSSIESKRASKRRRVPNKFYGYSSDEEAPSPNIAALKPQQPPKLEWRKEDLPSPVTHKSKKEVPSAILPQRLFHYTEPIRLTTPIPDPEPPRILMNTESMESSDSDSSEGNLEIYQPTNSAPIPPPTYLNSGTSSLPYPFQRPAVRQAREGESVYCYCRCPYDEVSEMIACDAEGCPIEWFHFECVGIMVPPKGKWYCPECRKNQNFSGYR